MNPRRIRLYPRLALLLLLMLLLRAHYVLDPINKNTGYRYADGRIAQPLFTKTSLLLALPANALTPNERGWTLGLQVVLKKLIPLDPPPRSGPPGLT